MAQEKDLPSKEELSKKGTTRIDGSALDNGALNMIGGGPILVTPLEASKAAVFLAKASDADLAEINAGVDLNRDPKKAPLHMQTLAKYFKWYDENQVKKGTKTQKDGLGKGKDLEYSLEGTIPVFDGYLGQSFKKHDADTPLDVVAARNIESIAAYLQKRSNLKLDEQANLDAIISVDKLQAQARSSYRMLAQLSDKDTGLTSAAPGGIKVFVSNLDSVAAFRDMKEILKDSKEPEDKKIIDNSEKIGTKIVKHLTDFRQKVTVENEKHEKVELERIVYGINGMVPFPYYDPKTKKPMNKNLKDQTPAADWTIDSQGEANLLYTALVDKSYKAVEALENDGHKPVHPGSYGDTYHFGHVTNASFAAAEAAEGTANGKYDQAMRKEMDGFTSLNISLGDHASYLMVTKGLSNYLPNVMAEVEKNKKEKATEKPTAKNAAPAHADGKLQALVEGITLPGLTLRESSEKGKPLTSLLDTGAANPDQIGVHTPGGKGKAA